MGKSLTLYEYKDKLILPVDFVTDKKSLVTKVMDDEKIYDIGVKSIELFKKYLQKSALVIWNGPMGMFEDKRYENGTKGICEVLKDIDAIKIVGGGDSVSFVNNNGYDSIFTHISTGGGATLELLEGKDLPGIRAIK